MLDLPMPEWLRLRSERMDSDMASLRELAKELFARLERGEISPEEYDRWAKEISDESLSLYRRTLAPKAKRKEEA